MDWILKWISRKTVLNDDLHNQLQKELRVAGADRLWYIGDAFRYGYSIEQVQSLTQIDPWFLVQIADLVQHEQTISGLQLKDLSAEDLFHSSD